VIDEGANMADDATAANPTSAIICDVFTMDLLVASPGTGDRTPKGRAGLRDR